jgi:hypothetical protein
MAGIPSHVTCDDVADGAAVKLMDDEDVTQVRCPL